jgi:hypothetical protein
MYLNVNGHRQKSVKGNKREFKNITRNGNKVR